MKASELIKKYLEFFESKDHKTIPSSSIIPEHDPTVLFTTAGMHPLVPFLMGHPHPRGKRLCNVQKCLRTGDIDRVGNSSHLTFFFMLGNWSLGDYFKEDAIAYSYEFLTKLLKIDENKLSVSCFAGDKDCKKDEESAKIWKELGIPAERIYFFPKEDNWWGPAGETGPCGPCTEMFIDTGKPKCSPKCNPSCNCGKYFEIWNDVFLEYEKKRIKAIIGDAMHCLINKETQEINKVQAEMLKETGLKIIISTNSNPKKVKEILKNYDFEIFSLEKDPDKSNPEYFEKLLKKYSLNPGEVIYFDHKEDNIKSAKKVGIKVELYENDKKTSQFIKKNIYKFGKLKQKNVDTGMGVERTITILQGKDSVYETDLFEPIISEIKKHTKKDYIESLRIIADHMRAAVFILGEGKITPSNLDQGYVLRRLIRRAIRHGKILGIEHDFCSDVAKVVVKIYEKDWPELKENKKFVLDELKKEEHRFRKTLEKGLSKFNNMCKDNKISAEEAFLLFQSYGFPIEIIKELAKEKRIPVDEKGFQKEFEKHQEISRVGAEKKFKGGLADASEQTTKLHTATHLLAEALRQVLKDNKIQQKGSNINPERLRFDFNFNRKLTKEELEAVEALVNEKINENLPIECEEMTIEQAKKSGAQGVFEAKYGEKVFVYSTGEFSKEICGGPHVKSTSELGKFRIKKEESSAAGIRRIKAVLE